MSFPRRLFALAGAFLASAADYHVAPGGSDAGPGTAGRPFATLERARDARRRSPGGADTVWVHPGTYVLDRPFALTAADSGRPDARVVYRAAPGGPVRLVGGRRLTAADFRPVTEPKALARVRASVRGRLVEADLAALGVRHAGRYPDVFADNGGLVELFAGGRRLPLARYPNDGYLTMERVLDTAGGLQDGNWREPANLKLPPADRGGTFVYRPEHAGRHAAWAAALDRGVWLKGYWRVAWQNEAVRVKAIDPAARTVTLARPVPGGIGSKYHRPRGSGTERYWLMNLLEEIDRPGEWCVDFADHKLYLLPPGPLAELEMFLADRDAPVIDINGASHVTLRGLTVEANLGHGIRVRGGAGVHVAGCAVTNVTRYAVVLDGGTGHEVRSCDLSHLGAGGVWLGGGDEAASPRVPAGHRVVNNHIHHFAEVERVYAPGVNCGFTGGGGGGHHPAVGMTVAHNLIHDTPHGGVLFGSWDNLFEFNEVFRYCTASNDLGAFYSYDRFDRSGGHTIRYNLMHSTGDGDGVYFDHDHRDVTVFGNIACFKSGPGKRGTAFLYKIGSQAKNPQGIDCRNNVAVACNAGFVVVGNPPVQVADNVVVACKRPWSWRRVVGGKEATAEPFPSGPNAVYADDPGFADVARLDFRLRPGARLLKDLPGFRPIPVEKIGLYVDEDRRALPDPEAIDRFDRRTPRAGGGDDVLDRN